MPSRVLISHCSHQNARMARMTAAEPVAPRPSEAGGRYNLAAQVYGDGEQATNGSGNGSHGNGAPAAGEGYNLAAQVYGDGELATNGDGSNGAGAQPAAERYNLATRVYGGGGGDQATNGDGSNGAGAQPATERYNLATRVYGGSGGEQATNGDGSNGAGAQPAAERYNLATRLYGGSAGNQPTNGDGSNGAGAQPAAERYNLAARVYGNGHAIAVDLAPNAAPAAASPAVAAAPGVAEPAVAEPAAGPAAEPQQDGGGGSFGAKLTLTALAPEVGGRGGPRVRTFESFGVSEFRWFFLAMLGQFTGMNMQMFIRGYLVFDLTGSFAALGAMSLANAVPMFFLSPVGGVIADRLPRKHVLQVGQLANGAIAAGIGVLLFLDMLRFEHLMMSALLQGAAWALMMPARQAMIPDLVGERRMMNAVALNTAGMNLMRLVAPGMGGLMVAWLGGASWVYVLMASSFILGTFALIPIKAQPAAATDSSTAGAGPGMGMRRGRGSRSWHDMVEGFRYIQTHRTVFAILAANLVMVMFSFPYMMMLPGFVADVLDGGPSELGFLMMLTGVGALGGSLVIASMPDRNRGKILLLSSILLGVALIAFSVSRSFWLTAAIMLVIGVGQTGRMSLSNVLIQAYVDNEYRGRVMSIYMMEFAVVSFGVFFVGILSAIVGVQWAIGGTAVALLVFSVATYLFYPRLRDLQ